MCSAHQVPTKHCKDLAEEGMCQATCHFGKLYLPNAATLKERSHLCQYLPMADVTTKESSPKGTWFLSKEPLFKKHWEAYTVVPVGRLN